MWDGPAWINECSALMRWIIAALLALGLTPAQVVPQAAPQSTVAPNGWLRQLRFSPDGRYVLAQDDAEVTVLGVRRFEILFRLPAKDATLAQFTPDSAQVVFVSSVPPVDLKQVTVTGAPEHVERWQIVDRARNALAEVRLPACGTVALSPDGSVVACDDLEGTLWLVRVATGETVLEKKKFSKRTYLGTPELPCYEVPELPGGSRTRGGPELSPSCYSGDPGLMMISFSPDSRFVIAEPRSEGPAIAWDVNQRTAVTLVGALGKLRKSSQRGYSLPLPFTFVAPDLVLMPAELISFPSGAVVSKVTLPPSPVFLPATDSNFVLLRRSGAPVLGAGGMRFSKSSWAGAVEFRSGGEEIVSDQLALDVLGQYYVAEPGPGEVGLYERGKGIQARVSLHKK
jgi:hypothetical protein